MLLHTSEHVGGLAQRLNKALEDRERVDAWAGQNIHECHFDCSEDGRLVVAPSADAGEYRIFCPLLSQKCPRGAKFLEQIKDLALGSLPDEIPTIFRSALPAPKDTDAIYGAYRWKGKGVLYLHGGTGTGKSFAAAWRVFDDLHKRLLKYWDSPALWNEHASCPVRWFSAYSVCLERANLYAAESASMLVLDDLGCELFSNANFATLNELIGVRYNFNRPTIITSNLTMAEFSKRYQSRMYERILQSNNIIDTGEDSIRLS